LLAHAKHIHLPTPQDDIELEMAFDGDEEEDEEEGSGRSGSAELEMDIDEEDDDGEVKPEWKKLALGTGSGGVKGRRKGMVFKCENCSKVGSLSTRRRRSIVDLQGIPSSELSRQASVGTQSSLERAHIAGYVETSAGSNARGMSTSY
jgi:hypothetical protein